MAQEYDDDYIWVDRSSIRAAHTIVFGVGFCVGAITIIALFYFML